MRMRIENSLSKECEEFGAMKRSEKCKAWVQVEQKIELLTYLS
jgi:hypothetical protein